jgi:hypothetical protein
MNGLVEKLWHVCCQMLYDIDFVASLSLGILHLPESQKMSLLSYFHHKGQISYSSLIEGKSFCSILFSDIYTCVINSK